MKNKKKLITTIASLALVGAISIGATLAYLNAQSQQMTNTFTPKDGGRNISIELREPGWDGYNFGEGESPDGSTVNPTYKGDKEALGLNEAKEFSPGDVIAKDPTVKNTCGQDVWVAVTVDKTGLPSYASLNWDKTKWDIVGESGNTVIAYYRTKVTTNGTTSPVFSQVTISDTATEVTGFDIDVKAYAIQGENIDTLDAAKAAFHTEFDSIFPEA